MQIGIKITKDIAILEVSGNLSGGVETSILHTRVKKLIADDICNVVIDLKHSRWINSLAIGVLLGCYTSLSRENGMIKLANVSDKIKKILEITHLTPFLRTYSTVPEAIRSFNRTGQTFSTALHVPQNTGYTYSNQH